MACAQRMLDLSRFAFQTSCLFLIIYLDHYGLAYSFQMLNQDGFFYR